MKDQQGHGTSKNPEAQCQTKFTQYALKKISCQKVTFENDFFRVKNCGQGNNVRKVNCCCVFSAYILKPVLSGRCLYLASSI